jgi:hypothetical protein
MMIKNKFMIVKNIYLWPFEDSGVFRKSHVLLPLIDSDKCEVLFVQLCSLKLSQWGLHICFDETVGHCTKLREDLIQLRIYNAAVRSQIYARFSEQPSQAVQIVTQGFIILTTTAEVQQLSHK